MVRVKSTDNEESSKRKATAINDRFKKDKLNQERALALAEGAREKIEPPELSKIVNGVKGLKVEASARSGNKDKMMADRTCLCKPCGKGPFGSAEEAVAHYTSGKHRGKSSVFTRLEGADKVNKVLVRLG